MEGNLIKEASRRKAVTSVSEEQLAVVCARCQQLRLSLKFDLGISDHTTHPYLTQCVTLTGYKTFQQRNSFTNSVMHAETPFRVGFLRFPALKITIKYKYLTGIIVLRGQICNSVTLISPSKDIMSNQSDSPTSTPATKPVALKQGTGSKWSAQSSYI